jgi:hypothetical protein
LGLYHKYLLDGPCRWSSLLMVLLIGLCAGFEDSHPK